jgi:predicted nucleic acid-binding Zn finger protein
VTQSNPSEPSTLKRVSEELSKTHALTDGQKDLLAKIFEKRLPPAIALVEGKKIMNLRFRPSGRNVWTVKGRRGEYQVIPESLFCTCDDYYFRVMDNKKQLCYHVIAQQLAQALGKFDLTELPDSRYAELASKLTERTSSGRS